MSLIREKLRAGIAILEASAKMLEQAKTEFSGSLHSKSARDAIDTAINHTRHAAIAAVREYDKP